MLLVLLVLLLDHQRHRHETYAGGQAWPWRQWQEVWVSRCV